MENYERDLRIKFDRQQRKAGINFIDHVDQGWFIDFLIKEIKERDNVINRELAKNYHNTGKDEVHIYRVPKGFEPDIIRIPIAKNFPEILGQLDAVDPKTLEVPHMDTVDIMLYPTDFFHARFRIGYNKRNKILAVQESKAKIRGRT